MGCGYRNPDAEGCGYFDVVSCAVCVEARCVNEDVVVARSVESWGGGESERSPGMEAEQEDIAGTAALVGCKGGTI